MTELDKIVKSIMKPVTDYDKLVNSIKNANIKECNDLYLINNPYPGAFYRKKYDDNNIKMYIKNGECKMWLYDQTQRKYLIDK